MVKTKKQISEMKETEKKTTTTAKWKHFKKKQGFQYNLYLTSKNIEKIKHWKQNKYNISKIIQHLIDEAAKD